MFYPNTISVWGDGDCPYEGAVSCPVFQTSGFQGGKKYSYSRLSNPTRSGLERQCAALEGGTHGFAFSSGLAAVNAVFSMLKQGDKVVVSRDLYGGTYRLINKIFKHYGINFVFADLWDLSKAKRAIGTDTAMVFAETPTNPTMNVADISALAELTHKSGGIFVVDNTFLGPYFQKPLALGADISVNSATKYLSGHHDTVAGIAVTSNSKLAERLKTALSTLGNGLSPFDSFLVLRGIRTLPLRMEKHQENAFAVAELLQNHPMVEKVIYPGLESHPGHELCKKQATGFGGVVSFYVKEEETAKKLILGGKIIKFAESLGGFRSLITYPITQTHASIPKALREKIGINTRLIRLSAGLCHKADIVSDLEQMLEK